LAGVGAESRMFCCVPVMVGPVGDFSIPLVEGNGDVQSLTNLGGAILLGRDNPSAEAVPVGVISSPHPHSSP
jgi:hypothetical protein